MTQLEAARKGLITGEMRRVAQRECARPEFIRDEVARGRLVIPANKRHLAGSAGAAPANGQGRTYPDAAVGHPGAAAEARLWVNQSVAQRWEVIRNPSVLCGERVPRRLDPTGIGRMITTKINANIGASPVTSGTAEEVEKLEWAQKYGADTLMDLSTGGDLAACRQAIIDHATIPIGTVPIYSMIVGRAIEDLTYDLFDEISAIMRQYDVTYSLGDGLRPGCLADASDAAQLAELRTLGELVQRAREAGVQAMVEGPGHVPLDQIAWNMRIEQEICDDAPFYVLGPLVTDAFPGYDHITSAIGATEAARAGAAMLCYVTPKEHVGLPKAEDVRAGCIAYKIAAHAGDIARGIAGARAWDDDLSRARAALNWPKQFEIAFDGETARALHDEDLEVDTEFCAMCGHDWCSLRISKEIVEFASGKAEGFQPVRTAMKSPGLTQEQVE